MASLYVCYDRDMDEMYCPASIDPKDYERINSIIGYVEVGDAEDDWTDCALEYKQEYLRDPVIVWPTHGRTAPARLHHVVNFRRLVDG